MLDSEREHFGVMWQDAHEISANGKTLSDSALSAAFRVLNKYSLKYIERALELHAVNSKFAPTPHDIIKIIDSRTGKSHVGADEAWSIVIASMDEFETVVITQQIAEARSIAMPIFMAGDEVGARMAFRDSYSRIIDASPEPVWFVSEGFDKARRADAINSAIQLGRLPRNAADKYAAIEQKTTFSGLIEDAAKKANEVDAKKMLSAIKSLINNHADDDGVKRREMERLEFEIARQQILSRVAEK